MRALAVPLARACGVLLLTAVPALAQDGAAAASGWFDWDRIWFLAVLVVLSSAVLAFINRGAGGYVEQGLQLGFGLTTAAWALLATDYDGDGWQDILLINGDAYVDHPAFGAALIGRFLEARGFRVGMKRWSR